ncbi:prepilin-type N-terminal cleavage/methylation domain-containing protein [Vibrio sp. RE86]|uniref:type IV pilin protein n=1 Tax=Vibrio sp. RE86 TaxID=2607605 RepID=UPI001493C6C2|nr:type IV pilin protein [Vibrio sp. RE86]NOH79008.1 prepilin-type N-terminal cleavage/methylation domain-containing protein [Vibrio sp. RE86]
MIRRNVCNQSKKSWQGMTLIELMIAVAIIGVLGAIAYPSYQAHILKGHRTVAMADLSKIQFELERQYQGSYASAAASVLSGGSCSFCEVDSDQFSLTVSSSVTSYMITATAEGTQANDKCSSNTYSALTLDQLNQRAPTDCW